MNIKQLITQLKAILLLIWKIDQLGPIQRKWIFSLIIHPKRQGRKELGRKLQNGGYLACCLGELGIIAGICEWTENGYLRVCKGGSRSGAFLYGIYDTVGLYSENGFVKTDSYDPNLQSLSTYNDSDKTWPEIALIILKDPIQYLKEKK